MEKKVSGGKERSFEKPSIETYDREELEIATVFTGGGSDPTQASE